jgi:hypothetical protein
LIPYMAVGSNFRGGGQKKSRGPGSIPTIIAVLFTNFL